MKYMKLFESKEEDKEIIEALEMCFQELKDKGYIVYISKEIGDNIYFSKYPIINRLELKASNKSKIKIPYFCVTIYKDINRKKLFNIKDIKEDILFTESYIKDEFNTNIHHFGSSYHDSKGFNSYCYKNIEYVPTNVNIPVIGIYFTKN